VGANKVCVAKPVDACCGNSTLCLPSNNAISAGDSLVSSHFIGKKGRDFDGASRDKDDSWYAEPADGSGYATSLFVNSDSFGLTCSKKHSYIVTHVMAIDNSDRNDEEIGHMHHRHFIDPSSSEPTSCSGKPPGVRKWWCGSPRPAEGVHQEDYVRLIRRGHFRQARVPVAFPMVVRHLHCNSSMHFKNGKSCTT